MRVSLVSLESYYDNSLALDYLASYANLQPDLREAVRFKVLVQPAAEEEDGEPVLEQLFRQPGDIVAFNTYVWNIDASINAAREIKAKHPNTVIVMGGMEASYTASELLTNNPLIDFGVVGEGEVTFAEMLRRLVRCEPLRGLIPGLAYRSALGVTNGGKGPIIQHLDDIPSPFQSKEFRCFPRRKVLYESYRGCEFSCGFCLYHRDYTKQRYFSIERVAADLRAIRDAGCTHVRFVDSTFNLHPQRTKAILELLREVGADVSVEVSAEFFDTEMIPMLPTAGIRHVDIGLQSTNKSALVAVNRKWYREEPFKRNAQLLRDHPALTLNVELIAGLPADDYEGLKRSIDQAVRLWPDHVSIYRLLGLKGTDLERRKEELGLRFSDEPPYELLEGPGFSRADLSRIELLTFSHLLLFNLGIGRYALRYAAEVLGMRPAELYDEFWEFTVKLALYEESEARLLSRFYSHGNRFDRDLPPGLEPMRVRSVLEAFFGQSSGAEARFGDPDVLRDLIDYGYRLAVLDLAEDQARRLPAASDSARLSVAPWCKKRRYKTPLYAEVIRQGAGLGDMQLDEIDSILFFVHPELGPASLAIDDGVERLLNKFGDGTGVAEDSGGRGANPRIIDLCGGERDAAAQLRDLRVLVAHPVASG